MSINSNYVEAAQARMLYVQASPLILIAGNLKRELKILDSYQEEIRIHRALKDSNRRVYFRSENGIMEEVTKQVS